jgi:hypothetical protein
MRSAFPTVTDSPIQDRTKEPYTGSDHKCFRMAIEAGKQNSVSLEKYKSYSCGCGRTDYLVPATLLIWHLSGATRLLAPEFAAERTASVLDSP